MVMTKSKTKFRIDRNAKTISVSSSGLIKILDDFTRKLDLLHENSIITDSHWKSVQKDDDRKYRNLWARYEDLHEDYRLLARDLVAKSAIYAKANLKKDLLEKKNDSLRSENYEKDNEIYTLESRIEALRVELRICNPKHPEFENESPETPPEELSPWNGKDKGLH